MEMHLSLGVSTIVALMAAHRTGKDRPIPATSAQRDIACISLEAFSIVPTDKPKRFDQATASTMHHHDPSVQPQFPESPQCAYPFDPGQAQETATTIRVTRHARVNS
jgi:hypothetical protein